MCRFFSQSDFSKQYQCFVNQTETIKWICSFSNEQIRGALQKCNSERKVKILCPTLTTVLFIALILKETTLSFSKMIDRCEG